MQSIMLGSETPIKTLNAEAWVSLLVAVPGRWCILAPQGEGAKALCWDLTLCVSSLTGLDLYRLE